MPTSLKSFIHCLKNTGQNGFEGLVGRLLQQLTGLDFYLARSGPQHGRDGKATRAGGGSVLFECKNYLDSTKLDDRELMAELSQAIIDVPDVDLWILATTREIPDQLLTNLQKQTNKDHLDILPLDCRDDSSGPLDQLCARFPDTVMKVLENAGLSSSEQAEARTVMDEIASTPGFKLRLKKLRERLDQPALGWPLWRKHTHKRWLETVRDEATSRALFGQPLNVLNDAVIRTKAIAELDKWWQAWPQKQRLFAMLGDEGDGKSWAVAQWLSQRIQVSTNDFPPVIFIPSRIESANKKLDALIAAEMQEYFGDSHWYKRLLRWRESGNARHGLPLVFVVLDGINERHRHEFWRKLMESRSSPEWCNHIALICTARSGYWNEHFRNLEHLGSSAYVLPAFDDDELTEALNKRQCSIAEYPAEMRVLLRKPRYLDLTLKHQDKLIECGDFTIARLFYEDWRDRCNRKGMPLSETGFNDLLRELAIRQHEENKTIFSSQDLAEALALHEAKQIIICELATSGVLNKSGFRWLVEEERLALGLGLLLVDRLVDAERKNEPLSEAIASWIEPHTGMDIQARILEQASLHSLESVNGISAAISTELLYAWLQSQNLSSRTDDPIEKRLTAYLPLCPQAYFELAEKIWCEALNHSWGQEVLLYGLIRWKDSPAVHTELPQLFEHWLGMVPLFGPPLRRDSGPNRKDHAQELHEKLSVTLGHPAETGNVLYDGFTICIVDDDGWLRLGRVALAVISHIDDRRPYIRAIIIGGIAEAVADYSGKYELFSWVLRSSPVDLWEELKIALMPLLQSPKVPCRQATARLLNQFGTETACQIRNTLDIETLFPPSDIALTVRSNPYNWLIQLNREHFQAYACRSDFQPYIFIKQAKPYIADKDLNIQVDMERKLEPIAAQLRAMEFWQFNGTTSEDHELEEAEVPLARYCPIQYGDVIRHIFNHSNNRTKEALDSLVFNVRRYELLLTGRERKSLFEIWKTLESVNRNDESGNWYIEHGLFLVTLPLWKGREQLQQLLSRDENSVDSLFFEETFTADNSLSEMTHTTLKQWGRYVWFLIVTKQHILTTDQIDHCLNSSDSFLRGLILYYLYEWSDQKSVKYFIDKIAWRWKLNQHILEFKYGSALLIRFGINVPLDELVYRLHPIFWGEAFHQYATDRQQWKKYANILNEQLEIMVRCESSDNLPDVNITFFSGLLKPLGSISLVDNNEHAMRFVDWLACWGGRSRNFSEMAPPNIESQNKVRRENSKALQQLCEEAATKGHHWLNCSFNGIGLTEAIEAEPELVRRWVNLAINGNPETRVYLMRAYTFYVALCETLLSMIDWHKEAAALYTALEMTTSPLNVVMPDTKLPRLYVVLMDSQRSTQILQLWENKLKQCCNDLELSDLVVAIRMANWGDSREWLKEVIATGLQSSLPFEQARALTLRGFFEDDAGAAWLSESIPEETWWLNQVLATAQTRVVAEHNARHWFQKFCEEPDLDCAWAAFRLFLHCTDKRCWLWLDNETNRARLSKAKSRFLRINRDTISKYCRENEKKWEKSFLDCKVNSDVAPWLVI
ncbi:MAG: hypothetical protein ACU837_13570 [Gammaproteobacteria bacterium]